MTTTQETNFYLTAAQQYANNNTTCLKVAVGCVIVPKDGIAVFGANRSVDLDCTVSGCLRVQKYGENSKQHRNPSDCRAVHSEVDAITRAATWGIPTVGAVAYVTRYPCEACARALVAAGISEVVYGRKAEISEETEAIFGYNGVKVTHAKWDFDDTEV